MTCRDLEHLLIPYAAGAPIPPEAAAHFAQCERCRRLAAAIGAPEQLVQPSPEQLSRIKTKMLKDLKPVKPLAPARLLFSVLMLIVAGAAAAGVIELGSAGWRGLDSLQRVAIFAALAAGSSLLAVLLIRQMVPGSIVLIRTPVSLIAVLGVMAGIFATLFRPHPEATFVATGLVCLRIGLECAIAAAFASWLVMRRGAILRPAATGALAGALGGLSGLALLEIFCPNPNEYHIIVWHLGSAIVAVLLGTIIGIVAENLHGRSRAPGSEQ